MYNVHVCTVMVRRKDRCAYFLHFPQYMYRFSPTTVTKCMNAEGMKEHVTPFYHNPLIHYVFPFVNKCAQTLYIMWFAIWQPWHWATGLKLMSALAFVNVGFTTVTLHRIACLIGDEEKPRAGLVFSWHGLLVEWGFHAL